MTKLKLAPLLEDKPVKVTIEIPAALHSDLTLYAQILAEEQGVMAASPAKLIVPMLQRFIATDRSFGKAKKAAPVQRT